MNDTSGELTRIQKLEEQVKNASLPPALLEKVSFMLGQASTSVKSGSLGLIEQTEKYVNFVISLPWNKQTADNLDLIRARSIFDKNHYGMDEIKNRIIDYLAVLKLKMQQAKQSGKEEPVRAPILCFIGLVGTGKTTLAYSIAEVMGRQIIRVPFGGMGSALDLRGQSRVHPDSEPGQIIKALMRAGSRNPVLLLDEIDRVGEESRADIMGVLVELLDPEQNSAFVDHYLDYPFNLSQVLFVATANNTKNIVTAVLDRLEPISMPTYTDSEKMEIGKAYVFPRERATNGLTAEQLTIDEAVWPAIIRPLGFDSGIRTLERTINGVCRKVARKIVEGKIQSVRITADNIKELLPTDIL